MTDTFDYLFGGWHKAAARRWRNPDGSYYGSVHEDASKYLPWPRENAA